MTFDTDTIELLPEAIVARHAPKTTEISRDDILSQLRKLRKADERGSLMQFQAALSVCELIGDLKVCRGANGELLPTKQFYEDAESVGVGAARAKLSIRLRLFEKRDEIEAEVKASGCDYPRLSDIIKLYKARQAKPAPAPKPEQLQTQTNGHDTSIGDDADFRLSPDLRAQAAPRSPDVVGGGPRLLSDHALTCR